MGKQVNRKIVKALTTASSIATAIVTVKPIIDDIWDKVVEPQNENAKMTVPDLYKKGFRIDISQAEKILDAVDFRCMPIALTINDAKPKYRNYIPNQIVSTNPKPGRKVEKGSMVCVNYLTEEVIAESQRLYDEAQQQKQERTDKNKETVSKIATNAKNKIKVVVKREKKETGDKEL